MSYKDLIYQWILRWRGAIIAAVALLLLLNVALTNTLVTLNLAKPAGVTDVALSATSRDGAGRNIFAIGSLALVSRDTALITATAGTLYTSVDVSPLPWFGIKNISIAVERDKNVEKVSGNNFGCSVYDPASGAFSSFSCGNPSGLFVYRTSDKDDVSWRNEPSLRFPQAYNATVYHDGVLGIANHSEPWLFYADAKANAVSRLQLPVEGAAKDQLGSTSVVADAADVFQPHFLLVDNSTGIVYFGQQNGSAVEYRKYEHKAPGYVPRFSTSGCILNGMTAYCYFGDSSASADSEGEDLHRTKSGDGMIVVIDFSQATPATKQYRVSKDQPIDHLYADSHGQLYGFTNGVIYSLTPKGEQLERVVFAADVGAVSAGTSLYYVRDNKLYEYDSSDRSTHLRFASDNLRVSNINLFQKTAFINAYVKDAPNNTLHTYKLLDEPNTTPGKRLVDKLPTYPKANQADIIDMDYSKDMIHVVLPNFVSYDSSGNIVPNKEVYQEQKQEIRNYLSGIIPSIDNYKLTYSRAGQPDVATQDSFSTDNKRYR